MNTHTLLYKNILWLPSLLWVVCVLSACDRDLDLPDIQGKKSIALLGELVAGDSFYIRAGQSIPLTSGSELKFEVLQGLAVSATDGDNKTTLVGTADDETVRLYTIPFTSSQKVLPLHTYNILAEHPTLGAASAAVEIPGPFTAKILDTMSMQYSTDPVLKVSIQINDPSAAINYYVIEVLKQRMTISEAYFYYNGQWLSIADNSDLYDNLISQGQILEVKNDTTYQKSYVRQTMYTDDMNTDNALEKGVFNRNRRIFLKDNTFNGTDYTTHIYISSDTASIGLLEQGRILLLVKTVPEKYYRFLKAYEQFSDVGGFTTFSQPVKVEGNIVNGVGMIGGAYIVRSVLYYKTY